MSELIDRIFDAEKISSEILTILNGLKDVQSAMNDTANSIKGIEAATRKAKGVDDLSASSAKLNDQFTKGAADMKKWEVEVAKLNEKTKQLTETEKQGAIEIAKARLELQAAQKATKEAALAEIELAANNGKLTTSYNSLAKEMKTAIAQLKAMDIAELNSAKGIELAAKIKAINEQLKETDAAMGNYQRNVGNYASAFEGLGGVAAGLPGALGKMGGAVEGVTMGFQALNTASPVGLINIFINILRCIFS
jgi:chromosome segregation ATPase